MAHRFIALTAVELLFWCPSYAIGEEIAPIVITAHYDNAIGASDAASQGIVGSELLSKRPIARPADVLEYIPGMVVTQHSGDGKANQYFLRGINLDHGTDFATTVNGVPMNMPTHAHGQGYSDLNALIPELINRVDYRKGPYFADEGDFSSAGSARVVYRTQLDRPLVEFTLGERGYQRGLVAGSTVLESGTALLMAFERLNNNGPWTVPEGLRKNNVQFILSSGSPSEGWSASLSDYVAHWQATDQVPQRLIEAGVFQGQPFGRFDSLDASDGATTHRTSLSGSWHEASVNRMTQFDWYVLRYNLDLFSNFTYSLDRASDQFAQTDSRTTWGGKAYRSWLIESGDGLSWQNIFGVQFRQDRIRLGLYDTAARQIIATVREDEVQQTGIGLFAESMMGWTSWLRTVLGLRVDELRARVSSQLQPQNSGTVSASKVSPRFSLILGPWAKTEFFFNSGQGLHSNDVRGATARVDARTGLPIESVPALVGSRGQEIGLKSHIIPNWQTALALWRLDFDSELVYVGDAGTTAAGRPSRRTGLEWSNHWTSGEHLVLDSNLAWTRPRYADGDVSVSFIPNAVQQVVSLTLVLRQLGPWLGSLGVRYIGAAPLTEDNTVRSSSSMTVNLRVERKMSNDLDLALDVLNLTDRKNNDIAYFYTSRLVGDPATGVADVHVHPADPRTLRLTARLKF